MIEQFVMLIAGLTMLWGGAELLVRHASLLAQSRGISPLIIGLTVVAVGTSLPELLVSAVAAIEGNIGIALGNIIGSNISNIGLILGIGALMIPLQVKSTWLTREVPFMIAVTLIFIFSAYTGDAIYWFEGLLLLILMSLFVLYIARFTLREMDEFKALQNQSAVEQPPAESRTRSRRHIIMALLGIAILLGGSKLTVTSGIALAGILGVSESIIGLTLIALGTSLPELATTIVSALRKEIDLAVGNVIGSNIFNLALVGGITALIRPISLSAETRMFSLEFPLLIFISLLLWPIMRTHLLIKRNEGAVLIAIYGMFIYFTVSG